MLIYAAIAAFGLLFLLVMLFVGDIFGGDHDVHVDDARRTSAATTAARASSAPASWRRS